MEDFKNKYNIEQRKKIFNELSNNSLLYHIPIIIQKFKKSKLPHLNKWKYLIEKNINIKEFFKVFNLKLNKKPTETIIFFIDNQKIIFNTLIIINYNHNLKFLYDKYKNIDGFLYIYYCEYNAFG